MEEDPAAVTRLDCYPSAPTDVEGRQAWMRARDAAFAAGTLKSPEGGTFGSGKEPKATTKGGK